MRPFVEQYDRMYSDKDYAKDINDFQALVDDPASGHVSMLEIGSGTGNQSFRLAAMMESVTAVEIDDDFADLLEEKLARSGVQNIRLERRPLELMDAGSFDVSAAFFHVLNYIGRESLQSFCDHLARHLKPGARFVADIWHAEAVLSDPPRLRRQEKRIGDDVFSIEIVPDMNREELTVSLQYNIHYNCCGDEGAYVERLNLFLWTRPQLVECFEKAGFTDVSFWDYRCFPESARDDSWRLWLRATRA